MAPIEGRNLTQLRDVFKKHEVEYLFVGKMAAILQGYPDTTQDADLFIDKGSDNGKRVVSALRELGFKLDDELEHDIRRGRDFIQLTDGPFDLDLLSTDANRTAAVGRESHLSAPRTPCTQRIALATVPDVPPVHTAWPPVTTARSTTGTVSQPQRGAGTRPSAAAPLP